MLPCVKIAFAPVARADLPQELIATVDLAMQTPVELLSIVLASPVIRALALEKVASTPKPPLKVRLVWLETVGEAEKSTVVWKALTGAAAITRGATPSPRATKALNRPELPRAAFWINRFDLKSKALTKMHLN